MRNIIVAIMAAGLVAACGGRQDAAPADQGDQVAVAYPADSAPVVTAEELGRTPTPAPTAAPAPARTTSRTPPSATPPATAAQPEPVREEPAPPTPAAAPMLALASGSEMAVTTTSEITSRTNKAGDIFTARVNSAVTDASGRTVIPAGATVTMQITEIKPAENVDAQGTLVVRSVRVSVAGEDYPLHADIVGFTPELRGRGVTAGDAGKVAGGAAAGAVLGKIIGKKTSGAVVGGVVGAAVGTAIAVNTADRDVVVPAGSTFTLRLTAAFERPAS